MVIRSKGQQPAVNAARQKNLSGNYRLWGPAADSVIAYGRSTQFSAVRHYLGRATAACPLLSDDVFKPLGSLLIVKRSLPQIRLGRQFGHCGPWQRAPDRSAVHR
jgi:hypothetical protein